MSLVWLVALSLGMGGVGLFAFLWSMRHGQYDDLEGAAERVLLAENEDGPLQSGPKSGMSKGASEPSTNGA